MRALPYFYPRPPRGGRQPPGRNQPNHGHFYPRPPRGGRRSPHRAMRWSAYFYPRPPRGGRQFPTRPRGPERGISIHVLREEDDARPQSHMAIAAIFLSTSSARRTTSSLSVIFSPPFNFYPRPPRGGRPVLITEQIAQFLFLSTSSARRTTSSCYLLFRFIFNFYPRPPRGGRLRRPLEISCSAVFLSTSSARRTTPMGVMSLTFT